MRVMWSGLRHFDGAAPAWSEYFIMMSLIARIISACIRIAVFESSPALPPIIGQPPIMPPIIIEP